MGWDGVGWAQLDPLLAAGRLPNLQRGLSAGVRAPLRSTVPPLTPPAWTAVATGLLPGRSGVVQFRRFDLSRPSGFDPTLVTSAALAGRTVFDAASRAGEGVCVVGFPMSWPPFPLPGSVVVAGWPRPRTARVPVWPRYLERRLGPWGEGAPGPRWRPPTLDEELASAQWWDRRHIEITTRLLRERDDGLTAVVLSGTDHLAHRLWGDPRLDAHLEQADRWLGELLNAAGPEVAVVLVSDHGFGPAARRRVHLGRWLERGGYLRRSRREVGPLGRAVGAARGYLPELLWPEIRDRLPGALRRWGAERARDSGGIDASQTRAVPLRLHERWEGLHAQVRGRQAQGVVPPGAAHAALLQELQEGLLAARDEHGEPLATRVLRADELFRGEGDGQLPDLWVELPADARGGDGFGVGPLVDEVSAAELADNPGSHRPRGVFAAWGPGLRAGATPQAPGVQDVGPTLLALAGVPVPRGLDGRALSEVLTGTVVSGAPLGPGTPSTSAAQRDRALRAQLQRLGYLR